MEYKESLLIEFSGDTEYVGIAELDDTLNVDDEGEEKTSFHSQEEAYVRLHLSSNVEVYDYKVSSGSISSEGSDTRTLTEEVEFDSEDENGPTTHTVSVVPNSTSVSYFGNSGSYETETNEVSGQLTYSGDTSKVPFVAEFTHSYSVNIYKVTLPEVELEEDDSYPVLVTFYVREKE